MIDRSLIGEVLSSHEASGDSWRAGFFERAIGMKGPDQEPVSSGGPTPPTFALALHMGRPDPFDDIKRLGLPLDRVLHAEQRFEYHRPIRVDDRVTFTSRLLDVYERKGAALLFVVIGTTGTGARGELLVEMQQTLVVTPRPPKPGES